MSSRADQKLQKIAADRGVILLYHSVMETAPSALGNTLHNVTVHQFKGHLRDLSNFFEFVSLDEFSNARSKAGLACITFDDGYKNVIENALPVMESLNYPCTIFLNPITFEQRWNWRDKVRYLIHYQKVDEFLKTYDMAYTQGRFYRYTKNRANDSADLDRALDNYLAQRIIDIYGEYPYLSINQLTDCPLVSYGNHTQNHYVLSSLIEPLQTLEISLGHENITNISNLSYTGCFAAPFGGVDDINSASLKIIAKMSYQSLLMSRQLLQPKKSQINKVQILERFMPRSDNIINELVCAVDK